LPTCTTKHVNICEQKPTRTTTAQQQINPNQIKHEWLPAPVHHGGIVANKGNHGQFNEETIIPHKGDIGTRCYKNPTQGSTGKCGSMADGTGRHGILREEAISRCDSDRLRVPQNHNVLTGHTKNGEESNAEGGSRESIDDITTYPCQGMEGTSANNHLAVRNATKNHDNAATTIWGSYNKSQDGTNQIQEDMNKRAIYQHESANLLNTFQAIAPTGWPGLQPTNTRNAPRNARTPLPPRPSGGSQCPGRAV